MLKTNFFTIVFILCCIFTGCKYNKPKTVSSNITKTRVLINGKNDSVLNNQHKNYVNATIAEPCVKCLIGIIQQEERCKKSIAGIPPKNIIYNVNWIKTDDPKSTVKSRHGTNGLQVDVISKGTNNHKLLSYI